MRFPNPPHEVEKSLQYPQKMLLGEEWTDAISRNTSTIVDPANNEILSTAPLAGDRDVEVAVRTAESAINDRRWLKLAPSKRGEILWSIAESIQKRRDDLAQLEVLDQGKPLFLALREVDLVIQTFRYYAGWVDKFYGETLAGTGGYSTFIYTQREPIGVTAAIIPWNYPLLLASWKVAPALAFGNAVILKPAEQTPLTALRLGEIALEAGVPRGVLQVLTGGPQCGSALVTHPGVDHVSFTGSTEVGRTVMRSASTSLKRITLELGGKSANIVLADSEVDRVAKIAMYSVFLNSGQTCGAGTRLIVEDTTHDRFVTALIEASDKMGLGHGLDPETRIGPLISEEQLDRVMTYIQLGKEEGATLRTGGERAEGLLKSGFFVSPTVFTDVQSDMRIVQEEIFGPVLTVLRAKSFEDAIEIANNTKYGLAAGIWTHDLRRAHRAAMALKAGTVWVNSYGLYDPAVSFGGFKESGFGRALGRHSIEAYTQTKSVWIDYS